MGDLLKAFDRCSANFQAWAVGRIKLRMSGLQRNQLGHQRVVFAVCDFRFRFDVVEPIVAFEFSTQRFDFFFREQIGHA